MAGYEEVSIPASKFKAQIVKIIKEKGFIEDFSSVIDSRTGRENIVIKLKYLPVERNRKGVSFIQGLRRVSRQGQRIYAKRDELPRSKNGIGFFVISTSKGIMSDEEARKVGLGGEVICEIW